MKEREPGQIPHQEFHIEEINEQRVLKEELFEILFGYPLRLSEQIVEKNLFNDKLNQEIREFHQRRIDFIDEILERKE